MNIVQTRIIECTARRSGGPSSLVNGLLLLSLLVLLGVTGCDSDLDPVTTPEDSPVSPVPFGPVPGDPVDNAANASFSIEVGSRLINLTEGAGTVEVPLTIERRSNADRTISLSIGAATPADADQLSGFFTDDSLSAGESQTTLQLQLAIGPRPIKPQNRTLVLTAADTVEPPLTVELTLQVTPTPKPDVYLLIGQSNMVGISEPGAKQADPGGADEPDARIMQLNVTGNDQTNFSSAADFTNPSNLYNASLAVAPAVDPLHDGFESSGGKSGDRIGLGLSFAKRALSDTTSSIYLVPAAWSDTGFCKRDTNQLAGIGWNVTAKSQTEFAGTLLYDRAVARTNITLAETGGILRGILWHQGEADAEEQACAEAYAANLKQLVEALRTNIDVDARGVVARRPDADIPFIAGTMATGGSQLPFSETKSLVNAAHRTIAGSVAFADVANADDLVPPAFACGGGGCIHFGADAYREFGRRYYEQLLLVLQ